MGGKASKLIAEATAEAATELDLEECSLSSVPAAVFEIPTLTQLSLVHNSIGKVPRGISALTALRTLVLNRNFCTTLPDEMAALTALTVLRMQNNRFTKLPPVLGQLRALIELDLYTNRLKTIDESVLEPLENLERLVVEDNPVANDCNALWSVKPLRWVYAGRCKMSSVSDEIARLDDVRLLSLAGNIIQLIPDALCDLVTLTSLDISNNCVTSLPDNLGKLASLTDLNAAFNRLIALPSSIGECKSLRMVDLGCNKLEAVPHELCDCVNLSILQLNDNELRILPITMQNLRELSVLNLANNKLEEAPTGVASLAGLVELNMAGNPIKEKKLRKMVGTVRLKKVDGRKTFDRSSERNSITVSEMRQFLKLKQEQEEVPAAVTLQRAARRWLARRRLLRVVHLASAVHAQELLIHNRREEMRQTAAALRIQSAWRAARAQRNWAWVCAAAKEARGSFVVHNYDTTSGKGGLNLSDVTLSDFNSIDSREIIMYALPRGANADGGDALDNVSVYSDDSSNAAAPPQAGMPRIMFATLPVILEKLTDAYASDTDLRDAFILAYRPLLSPVTLLDALCRRFTAAANAKDPNLKVSKEAVNSSASLARLVNAARSVAESSRKLTLDPDDLFEVARVTDRASRIRYSVLVFLEHWVKRQPGDFRPTYMRQRAIAFLSGTAAPLGWGSTTARIMAGLPPPLNGKREEEEADEDESKWEPEEFKTVREIMAMAPDPLVPPRLRMGVTRSIRNIHAIELARQLALIESELFRTATAAEYAARGWAEEDGAVHAPNLLAAVSHFNHVSSWVTLSILSFAEFSDRADAIGRFVSTAKASRRLNNFNTVMEIVSALNSKPVARLKKTWARVRPSDKDALDELAREMSVGGNFALYRQALAAVPDGQPALPYIGVTLTDLSVVDETVADSQGKLINLDKLRRIARVLKSVDRFRAVPYSFVPILEIQRMVMQAEVPDDEELLEMSYQVEVSAGE